MPPTLQQLEAQLDQARALHATTLETVDLLINGALQADAGTRGSILAKLNGYTREIQILERLTRDIIGNGKLSENDLCILSGFDAPEPQSAAVTPPAASDAENAPRIGPRNEASAAPLPPAGDCF